MQKWRVSFGGVDGYDGIIVRRQGEKDRQNALYAMWPALTTAPQLADALEKLALELRQTLTTEGDQK